MIHCFKVNFSAAGFSNENFDSLIITCCREDEKQLERIQYSYQDEWTKAHGGDNNDAIRTMLSQFGRYFNWSELF